MKINQVSTSSAGTIRRNGHPRHIWAPGLTNDCTRKGRVQPDSRPERAQISSEDVHVYGVVSKIITSIRWHIVTSDE